MTAILIESSVLLLLLVANGVFAMTEMAMVSSRKSRLRVLAEAGQRGARTALALAEEPNRFLPSVQVGITLVGLTAGAIGGATLAEEIARRLVAWPIIAPYAEAAGVGIVVLLLTFLSLVIGELVPKRLALANPERIASLMAGPLDLLSRLARPAIWVLGRSTEAALALLGFKPAPRQGVSEDEVRLLMEEGRQEGVFHPNEPRMVESVLSFDQRPVSDVMTPREKVIFLHRDEAPERVWHKIVVSGHSNYPVYDLHRDHVIGMLSVKALYANLAAGAPAQVRDIMVPPLAVPDTLTVSALLDGLKRTGQHIAVVHDSHHRLLGLVTLVDLLEAIVGEIPTREERLRPEARRRPDGSWLVDGRYPMASLQTLLEEPGISSGPEIPGNVAAFAARHLPAPAQEGRTFVWNTWRFEVLDADAGRISKLLLTREPASR